MAAIDRRLRLARPFLDTYQRDLLGVPAAHPGAGLELIQDRCEPCDIPHIIRVACTVEVLMLVNQHIVILKLSAESWRGVFGIDRRVGADGKETSLCAGVL